MNILSTNKRVASGLLLAGLAAFCLLVPAHTPLSAQSTSGDTAAMDAQREKIWNSPSMLRARAWVHEYCERSAKISDAEGKKYMAELASLTPTQMKLWLLKFDEEHEQQQQRYALWQKAHESALHHAMAADKAAQASMAALDSGETAAANQEQGVLNEQQKLAAEASQDKRSENAAEAGLMDMPLGPYGYGGYNVHYHLYPPY